MAALVFWSIGLILLLVVTGVLIGWVRRRMSAAEQAPETGFTLGQLRDLHRQGKMTDAELLEFLTRGDAPEEAGPGGAAAAGDHPPNGRR